MPRRLRIEMPGGVYHVTNRGVDRRDIVIDDHDRREWFRLFGRVASRCRWQVFAHVLMTNHFHLFLRLTEANLSSGMHDWESGYASLFNARHDRVGVLFQSRFHAVLIESEGHGWTVSRYLHLNPCRAKLVERPEDYRWSTYRYYLDPAGAPPWLDWRTILSEVGGSEGASRIAYRRFVNAGLEAPPANPLNAAVEGALLGGESFVEAHRHLLDRSTLETNRRNRNVSVAEVITFAARELGVVESAIRSRGRHENHIRDAVVWLCRERFGMPVQSIADALGNVGRTAISEALRRCELRQRDDAAFRALCERLLLSDFS